MPPLSLSKKPKLLLSLLSLCFLFVLLPSRPHHYRPHYSHRRHLTSTGTDPNIARHCDGTLYPELCASTLATLSKTNVPISDAICHVIKSTTSAVRNSRSNCSSYLTHLPQLDQRNKLALQDCLELLDQTLDELSSAFSGMNNVSRSADSISTVQTVLSGALTNQYTCLDGFAYAPKAGARVRPYIKGRFFHVAHLISNSLAMVKKLPRKRRHLRETFEGYGRITRGYPQWVSGKDRHLLQVPSNATIMADLVVAKDGSGNFTTVTDAINAAPNNSDTRFVIYVKAGGYYENVEVGKSKTNIMLIGDGMWKTTIKGNRNVVDGWTTFRSATVAVVGNGFIARDLTIENYAGPSKHQAVALRVSADLTAFYRCSFVGYQDTLYTHSLRQFYRECDIYGTIDFIFGDAAVVLQNCNLYARKPDPNQVNVFTAQGREDPNQNTGISIQNCKVAAAADLIPVQSNFSTYLGRPWKQYSRTVYMQSNLESLINPAGWLPWNGTFALDTLYYGEYMNRGAGANTTGRVNWPGYHVIKSSVDANNFTVSSFIQGDQWLSSTMIPFMLGLN
ncbi:pectinesterase-like protein [Carex littledalei]|uniref:Pectinesterase n=1 Tax=Carex littledalei TaxID=544730 RepID=A0A833V1U4_9POAL|nr:pectinesterase-like protein [Carex littledalei]